MQAGQEEHAVSGQEEHAFSGHHALSGRQDIATANWLASHQLGFLTIFSLLWTLTVSVIYRVPN